MEVSFRPMMQEDYDSVAEIFSQGIATGNATFETQIPDWEKWDAAHIRSCRIIATVNNVVTGWAALIPVSSRKVYAGVGELSIYISNAYRGLGIGNSLLERLIDESEKEGFWTLQAGIFPENTASIRLHQNHGFRIVGYREKIGQMDGIWRNTLLLERRSKVVGIGEVR